MTVTSDEHRQLQTVIGVILLTGIPMLALEISVGIASGSLSVVGICLDTAIAQVLNISSLLVLRLIQQGNVYTFPYGTGKLEDFSSFFYGCGIIVSSLVIYYNALLRIVAASPAPVSLGMAQIALLVGVFRLGFLSAWLKRLMRQDSERTPLFQVYYVDYCAAFWYQSCLLIAMSLGWFFSSATNNRFSCIADIVIALSVATYLLIYGIRGVQANFRSMLDLPLSETDQLKILRILAEHYDDYHNIGRIYSRLSGNQRRIEIELTFESETPIQAIELLRSQLQAGLQQQFSKLEFHLIARANT